ncbi:MAG: hypothetical protein ACRDRG_01185, partial [Pseudonocardiaceae bacterium]
GRWYSSTIRSPFSCPGRHTTVTQSLPTVTTGNPTNIIDQQALTLRPAEAAELAMAGRTPGEVIAEWWRAGIPFDEVADWIGAGLTATEAVEQRVAGVTVEQAAALRALRNPSTG